LAERYFDGSIANAPVTLTMQSLNSGQCEVRFNTVRGFYYQVQSCPNLTEPFANDGPVIQAVDSSVARTNAFTGAGTFYRVRKQAMP
jgi:hypothetical protein